MRRWAAALTALTLIATACSADATVSSGDRAALPSVAAGSTGPATTTPPLAPATDEDSETGSSTESATVPPADDPQPPSPTATNATTPQPDGPCDAGPLALPNPDRPRYLADVTVDPTQGTAVGSWSVDFTPDLATSEIVIRLWPNGPRPAGGGTNMTLSNVTVGGQPTTPTVDSPTLLRLPLQSPLESGETIRLTADFELSVPGQLNSRISRREDFMRLGTFLPLLPWEPGRGWATDPATALFAEAVSSPVADYAVRVAVPDGFDALASGVVDGDGVWTMDAGRDFALSVGRFRTVSTTAQAPTPVQVTVGVHETLSDDEHAYLDYIVASLESFSDRWGQYPWPSLTFALTPGLSGGIEFPTHIMQGPETLGRTTSHEVGHMFFYSLVGNNQGTAPWLDEGITSYAEFTFEGTPPNAYGIPSAGVGNATQPMTFWESNADIYYRSVYGQTGFALQQLGSQEDVDCALARYVAANAHRIATADDFLAAFEPTFPDVRDQLAALGVVLQPR